MCLMYFYTTGLLNAWIWLADERSKVCNYFQENALRPYHFAKWFQLFQRSYNSKISKAHNDTGQTNKYSKQYDKNNR